MVAEETVILGVMGLFFGAFAVVMLWIGLRELRSLLTEATATAEAAISDPVPPTDVPDSGHAVVTGRVEPGPDEPTTPFGGRACAACWYRIDQRTDGVGWWTVVDDTTVPQFELQGAVDSVSVDPGETVPRADGRTIEDSDRVASTIRASDAFDSSQVDLALPDAVADLRRYVEGTLDAGEEVYIYGRIATDGGRATLTADGARDFQISRTAPAVSGDETTDAATSIVRESIVPLFCTLIGLVFLVVGILMIDAVTLGIISLAVDVGVIGP